MPSIINPEVMQSIDPNLLERFQQLPDWGKQSPLVQENANYRVQTAQWTPDMRSVYVAVGEGYTDVGDLTTATGLTQDRIAGALNQLQTRGSLTAPITEGGLPIRIGGTEIADIGLK